MKPEWVNEADEREELAMFGSWLNDLKSSNPELHRYLTKEEK